MKFKLFLISIVQSAFCVVNYLDLDEIQSNSYTIHINSDPVILKQEYDESTVLMRSKFGQQYECSLPEQMPIQLSVQQESEAEKRTIIELLEPLKSSSCLTKVRDWWTYKICFGEDIKQYHVEEGKGVVGPVMSLGRFDSDFDWDSSTKESANRRLSYHSQIYSNGTRCDVNGELRKTEVRIFCNEENTHYFVRIDEPSSCQYIAEIHTDLICKHPYTKLPFKSKPKEISCSPILSTIDYEDYQVQEKEKKKQAYEKRNEWLAIGKDKLSKLKEQNEKDSQIKSNEDQEMASIRKEPSPEDNEETKKETKIPEGKDSVKDQTVDDAKQTIKKFLASQLEKMKQKALKNDQDTTEDQSSESRVPNEKEKGTSDSLIKPQDDALDPNDLLGLNKDMENDHPQIDESFAQTKTGSSALDLDSDNSANEPSSKVIEEAIGNEKIEFKSREKEKLDASQLKSSQKVKIKIIRVKDENEFEEWSDEATVNLGNTGHKTIIAYVQGEGVKDSLNEIMKQQEIEKNYRFTYNNKKKKE